MNRGIIQYNNCFLGYFSGKIVQASCYKRGSHGSQRIVSLKRIIAGKKAKNVPSGTLLRDNRCVVPDRLPAVRHGWRETKTTLVPEIDLEIRLVFEFQEDLEFGSQACVCCLILLRLEPFTQAVPRVR